MEEALRAPRGDWHTIFNDQWPSSGAVLREGRRELPTWCTVPNGNINDVPLLCRWATDIGATNVVHSTHDNINNLPVLRRWATDIAAVCVPPNCTYCNSLAYVAVDPIQGFLLQ